MSERFLTAEEIEVIRQKTAELREAIEKSQRDVYDEHAFTVANVLGMELLCLLEKIIEV